MGWFARLFGRERTASRIETPSGYTAIPSDPTSLLSPSSAVDGIQQPLHTAVEQAIAPTMVALQDIRQRLDALLAMRTPSPTQMAGLPITNAGTVDRETMEEAIQYALAHFYRLLRGHEEFKVPAAMLDRLPDGNTLLPLDPKLQHFLVVMHPLYPHIYTTLIVLPGTFTHVDELQRLPNGVQVYSLHINTKKAPPGFMDALIALHRENWENLFLGTLTAAQDGASPHTLQYFRCTGSEIRNPAPDKFRDHKMIYFNGNPEPFILRQNLTGAEEVFSAWDTLEREYTARDDSTSPSEHTDV